MAFVLSGGERGETIIDSRGIQHTIIFTIDPVRQEPKIERRKRKSNVKTGSRVTITWPNSACWILDDARDEFLQKCEDYTWANPHLTLHLFWKRKGDKKPIEWTISATNPAWRKWLPFDPTSPHWYSEASLGRLMAAYIAHDQDHPEVQPHTLRGFISEFRGLSGTSKARDICEAIGATRQTLASFYGDGRNGRVKALLAQMQKESRPVKPRDLGVIRREHLLAKFEAYGVAPESFTYKCADCVDGGLPYVIETAFGYCPKELNERRIITGLNWSVALGDPFRDLGSIGQSLGALLTDRRAGPCEPIALFVHVACPRLKFLDRGKSSVSL